MSDWPETNQSHAEYIVKFLRALNEQLPPPNGAGHALMCPTWAPALTIQCNVDGNFYQFALSDMDFAKSPADLAEEIAMMAKSHAAGV